MAIKRAYPFSLFMIGKLPTAQEETYPELEIITGSTAPTTGQAQITYTATSGVLGVVGNITGTAAAAVSLAGIGATNPPNWAKLITSFTPSWPVADRDLTSIGDSAVRTGSLKKNFTASFTMRLRSTSGFHEVQNASQREGNFLLYAVLDDAPKLTIANWVSFGSFDQSYEREGDLQCTFNVRNIGSTVGEWQ